jgi:hypothetical protein
MNSSMLAKLAALRGQPKFVDEPGTIYNGMRPEAQRLMAEAQLNDLIDRLRHDPRDVLPARFVLGEVRKTLRVFPGFYETEDRERMCRYMMEIMGILEIPSARGLFSRWMFGWLLGTVVTLLPRAKRP